MFQGVSWFVLEEKVDLAFGSAAALCYGAGSARLGRAAGDCVFVWLPAKARTLGVRC